MYFCREVIINVMEVGTACDEDTTRVQSQAVTNLVSAGVSKSTDLNEAPDWGLIIGQYKSITMVKIYSHLPSFSPFY